MHQRILHHPCMPPTPPQPRTTLLAHTHTLAFSPLRRIGFPDPQHTRACSPPPKKTAPLAPHPTPTPATQRSRLQRRESFGPHPRPKRAGLCRLRSHLSSPTRRSSNAQGAAVLTPNGPNPLGYHRPSHNSTLIRSYVHYRTSVGVPHHSDYRAMMSKGQPLNCS